MSELTQAQWAELRAPFPPEQIGQKPKKNKTTGEITYLDYIGHAEITERLNSVDPLWTWEPMAVADDGAPLVRENGSTLELWINLTVGNVTRPAVGTVDVGAWSGETAKELVSDALRNAAMRFGVGLDLWKKHGAPTTQEWVNSPTPPSVTGQTRPAPQPPARVISDPNQEAPITSGQSKNAYRLFKKLEKENMWDRPMYFDAILISTGIETTDDRTLSSREAGKLITYLKEQAGEEDTQRPAPVQDAPAPDDSLFAGAEEPF